MREVTAQWMNFLESRCPRDLLSHMLGSELIFPIGLRDGKLVFSS